MNYDEFKQQVGELTEDQLQQFVQNLGVIDTLTAAVSYAIFPAGKRIRPLLALACCHDLGGDYNALVKPASAIELLHASSLIHDDLPALDNDDFRRGRPSCHRQFGEATAILAGDLLIAAAFKQLSSVRISPLQESALTAMLAQAFVDVCHGQQRDLIKGEQRGSLDLLHRLKTGALFRVSMQFGTIISGINQVNSERLADYGEMLGIYFQIIDDLIDLKGNEEQKGRPSGSDQRNHRETYGSGEQQQLEFKRQTLRDQLEELISTVENELSLRMGLVRNIFEQIDGTI